MTELFLDLVNINIFLIRPFKEATVKISHLGLIDKESLKEAIEQRNFVGDTKRDDSEKKSNQEIHNRTDEQRNFRNVSSMSNQEIHNLLQEEVDRIKANKTKSEKKNQNYPEPYSKEISYEGSL